MTDPHISEEEAYDLLIKHWNSLFSPAIQTKLKSLLTSLQKFQETYGTGEAVFSHDEGYMMDVNLREDALKWFIKAMEHYEWFPKSPSK